MYLNLPAKVEVEVDELVKAASQRRCNIPLLRNMMLAKKRNEQIRDRIDFSALKIP